MWAGAWYTLIAYMHLQEALAAVQADSEKRLEPQVPIGKTSRVSGVEIARGAEIRAVPELPGSRFNPAVVRFSWLEDWHRAEFRLLAAADVEGFTTDIPVNGRISFYVEGLLVGELPIWTYVSENAAVGDAEVLSESPSASLFQAIFPSYSHEGFSRRRHPFQSFSGTRRHFSARRGTASERRNMGSATTLPD